MCISNHGKWKKGVWKKEDKRTKNKDKRKKKKE